MPNLEDAIGLALGAHLGQVDKAGQPYILHPLRVMLSLETEEERIVGVLHDVLEDTGLTLDDLRARGYSDEVVEAIACVSKRPDEEGDAGYPRFIARIKREGNPLAVRVKLADLADNLDVSRLTPPLEDRDLSRLNRYLDAVRMLRKV